ncbi:hypothetical protein [Streptomyces sp. NPDC059909]|uniref:hypothetical protein n=1 Tax=Streptomyces sp. NPDC059909 TaxID=3346998 RepID=UPI0036477B2C
MTPERDEPPRTPELDALLDAARRPGPPDTADAAAQERALAAFRAARDEGLHTAPARWRRRGRDDWRPAGERGRVPVLVKALIAGLVAAALGGATVAAVEGVIPSPFDGDKEPGPARTSPVAPGPGQGETRRADQGPEEPVEPTPPDTGGSLRPGPDAAADDLAHCRVYLAALDRKRVPPRGEAMKRLEAAAGGPEGVRAWCEQLADAERKQTGEDAAQGDGAQDGPRKGQSAEESGSAATVAPGRRTAGTSSERVPGSGDGAR